MSKNYYFCWWKVMGSNHICPNPQSVRYRARLIGSSFLPNMSVVSLFRSSFENHAGFTAGMIKTVIKP